MFKLEYKIETEEIPIDDKKTQRIEVLQIEAHTDYPNTPRAFFIHHSYFEHSKKFSDISNSK